MSAGIFTDGIFTDEFLSQVVEEVSRRLPPTVDRPWLTRQEAAERMRCSVRQVDRLTRLGELPSYRLGGKTLLKAEECDQYITNRREQ